MPRSSLNRITCFVAAFTLGLIISPLAPMDAHADAEIAKPQASSEAKKIYIGDINATDADTSDDTIDARARNTDEGEQKAETRNGSNNKDFIPANLGVKADSGDGKFEAPDLNATSDAKSDEE